MQEEQRVQQQQEQHVQYYVMGIDEAGRGPVIGPLVYGTAFCKIEFKEKVQKVFKVKDSKKLTAQSRSSIFKRMDESSDDISYFVSVVSADEISRKMLRRQKYSLNQISFDCAVDLIEQVLKELHKRSENDASGVKHVLQEVYVDTVGRPAKYQSFLEEKFPNIDNITVSVKADDLFPIVSASSIIAKVVRDSLVEELSTDKIGSGYPGDKDTRDWLKATADKLFGFDSHIVRFSWSTVINLLKEDKFVSIEWSDEEEGQDSNASSNIFTFAVSTDAKSSGEERDHNIKFRDTFFTNRGLKLVTMF